MSSPQLSPRATTLNANAKPFVPRFGSTSSDGKSKGNPSPEAEQAKGDTPQKLNANANEFIPKRKILSSSVLVSSSNVDTNTPLEPETKPTKSVENLEQIVEHSEQNLKEEEIPVAPREIVVTQIVPLKPDLIVDPSIPLPLSSSWIVYGLAPNLGDQNAAFQPVQVVGIHDVETLWGALNNLPQPSAIHVGSTYYYFRGDSEPRWEHPSNEVGGCWIIMVRHDDIRNRAVILDKLWEEIVLGVSGGEFDLTKKEINGTVCKVRNKQFTLQIWTKSCNSESIKPIGEALRKLLAEICPELKTTSSNNIEFYSHQQLEKCSSKAGAFLRVQPMFNT